MNKMNCWRSGLRCYRRVKPLDIHIRIKRNSLKSLENVYKKNQKKKNLKDFGLINIKQEEENNRKTN
jgi:hypothetical protein